MALNSHPFRRWTSSGQTRTFIATAIFTISLVSGGQSPAQEPATNALATSPPSAEDLLSKASQESTDGNLDQAVRDASLAIQLDSHNSQAFETRGSIYIQGKLWDRAERDYATADHLSPDNVYKFKLAEIKFLQKAFDDARPRFAKLQGDAQIGDLAKYKVFLCDLLGFHEATAANDLAALDQVEKKPSYYYSHAIWDLYHNQRADALNLQAAARQLYGSSIDELYSSSVTETQRFHPDTATFTAKDGTSYNQAAVFLENAGLRALTLQGWVTVPLDQLPDDLSAFPQDLKEQIAKRRAQSSVTPSSVETLTFTTKLGKSYDRVRWSLEDDGLSVLSDDGWITVPFLELPADPSAFPASLQEAILRKQKLATNTLTRYSFVSFTTRQGNKYDQVKASLTEGGVRILTTNGWMTVPFAALPDDLAEFPPDWRPKIQTKRSDAGSAPFGMKVVSFTTTKGKHYDQVRAAMEANGLRLLTSQGLIAVSFNQLPDDLSAFPEEWRQKIAARQAELRKNAATK